MFLVVDCKCAYEEEYEISNARFDPETQICCQKGGVRERFRQGQEMDCCGGKKRNILLLQLFTVNENKMLISHKNNGLMILLIQSTSNIGIKIYHKIIDL